MKERIGKCDWKKKNGEPCRRNGNYVWGIFAFCKGHFEEATRRFGSAVRIRSERHFMPFVPLAVYLDIPSLRYALEFGIPIPVRLNGEEFDVSVVLGYETPGMVVVNTGEVSVTIGDNDQTVPSEGKS